MSAPISAPHNIPSDGNSNPAFQDSSLQISRPEQFPFAEAAIRDNSTSAVITVETTPVGT